MTIQCIIPECVVVIDSSAPIFYDVFPSVPPGTDLATRGPYCEEHFKATESWAYLESQKAPITEEGLVSETTERQNP